MSKLNPLEDKAEAPATPPVVKPSEKKDKIETMRSGGHYRGLYTQ